MTAHHDLDRQLNDFLREGPDELPYQSFDAVRDRTEQTGQRVVLGPWRLPEMNKIVTIGLGAAAAVIAVFIGAQLLGSPNGGTGGPGDKPTATAAPKATIGQGPSQAPSPSAAHTAVADFPVFPGPPQPVDAGIYGVGPRCQPARGSGCVDFPVSISFAVPAGWLSCANNAGLLCPDLPQQRTEPDWVGGVNIFIVTNVVADPCDETTLRDPSVGPTVDDLVTAISSLPWSAVTPPTEVTVDGFPGKEFEVTAPTRSPCVGTNDFATWATTLHSGGAAGVSPGERNRLRILDVQGTRVVIAGSYLPGTTSFQHVAEIDAIIDSVRIEPQGG